MIRVLQILDNITAGGIQSFVMNVYRNIDRSKIQFDFLIHHTYEQSFEDEIKKMGGNIFTLPSRNQGLLKNRKALNDFFRENAKSYAAVHFHESSLSYIEPLKYATKYSIPVRIMHSHSTNGANNFFHRVMHKYNKEQIGKYATEYLACGELAAKWMYGNSPIENKVKLVYNGINISKYQFDEQIRCEVRNELGISDKFVIGHAGRFEPVKNHKFLLGVMKYVKNVMPEAVLLLAGDGRTFEEMKILAENYGIKERVIFLGRRNDVHRLYQAMDVMVLPSFYEGFPVTAIEAEASGLPCVLSASITKEAALKENVIYLELEEDMAVWANAITKNEKRILDNTVLIDRGFSIESAVNYLTKLYLNIQIKDVNMNEG